MLLRTFVCFRSILNPCAIITTVFILYVETFKNGENSTHFHYLYFLIRFKLLEIVGQERFLLCCISCVTVLIGVIL